MLTGGTDGWRSKRMSVGMAKTEDVMAVWRWGGGGVDGESSRGITNRQVRCN